jgi:hypothetical protein
VKIGHVAVALMVLMPLRAAESTPAKAVLLSGNGVGRIDFGEAQDTAVASLDKIIGKSEGGVRRANDGDCQISAALYWTNFAAYFFRGRFDGYQTGNNLTASAAPAFNGMTSSGLRVGDTLAKVEKLYPGGVTTSSEQDGVYAISTSTGVIRGYLSMEVQSSPTKNTVMTISAGSVGCPAMSPG